mmetsp:Transcript_42459/g.70060  ORF Transcript_42459/g.70060 Transcript_42459/m.70060 type:complete len:226 (-) Transcript_42459:117-794(-)
MSYTHMHTDRYLYLYLCCYAFSNRLILHRISEIFKNKKKRKGKKKVDDTHCLCDVSPNNSSMLNVIISVISSISRSNSFGVDDKVCCLTLDFEHSWFKVMLSMCCFIVIGSNVSSPCCCSAMVVGSCGGVTIVSAAGNALYASRMNSGDGGNRYAAPPYIIGGTISGRPVAYCMFTFIAMLMFIAYDQGGCAGDDACPCPYGYDGECILAAVEAGVILINAVCRA